jgi:tetratricopeptide (TPR) repeat protein
MNALSVQKDLGRALMIAGRYPEAEKELLAAYEGLAERRGREHDETISAASLVAAVYGNWERWEEAVSWSREMLRLRIERYGPDHPNSAYGRINLGFILHNLGEDEEARQLLTQAAEILGARTPPHPGRFHAYMGLAMIDYAQQRFDEAARRQRQTLDLRIEAYGEDHIDVVESRCDLAKTLIELGRLDEAESLLRRAYEGLTDELLGPDFRLTVEINLADTLRRQRRLDEADELLARSAASAGEMDEAKPSTRSALAYAQAGLAAARGAREDAERLLRTALSDGEPEFRAGRDPDLSALVKTT